MGQIVISLFREGSRKINPYIYMNNFKNNMKLYQSKFRLETRSVGRSAKQLIEFQTINQNIYSDCI